ncbi:s-adenosyl-l-methionine-dependent methyltransferase [Lucifera butyrica]|uniref:S-adenosyl-L-methionine-dependent methyltransferase n=1 Tax=Lucifera butyrica TaxID=1351585 RepID=A0A498RCA5_9FIRM|nr:class I SAM-dependent methyltransferase [Lucifera butyrica]VBB09164.1 s-adenosyl-l-methionine-dependent methyltransferase [Lucifera butyrica]
MEEDQFSLTAVMCAYLRASHAKYDDPKIFDDFLAYQLIPDENRLLIEQGLIKYLKLKAPELAASLPDQTTALAWITRAMNSRSNLLSRSRYTEEALEAAVNHGTQQYVILGAGLDTFAFRRPDLLAKLHVFEVDHPNTQNFKTQRITELGWEFPAQLSFISMDFTQESLAVALKKSSYNPRVKSFFSWLGVTMYLTREEVFTTLRTIAAIAPAGSWVIFDYFDIDVFNPQKVDPQMQEQIAHAQEAGEPMKTGFDPAMLASDLVNLGFYLHEDLDQVDIQKRYLCGSKYVHLVQAIIK